MDTIKRFWKHLFRWPVEQLLKKCPVHLWHQIFTHVKIRMEGQYAETEKQTNQRAEEFLVKEAMLIFWGMAVLIVMVVSLAIYQGMEPLSVVFIRNAFGQGEKKVSVVLQMDEQEKQYTLTLAEKKLSRKEEEALKSKFFYRLEKEIAGENISLQEVNKNLCLENTIPDWPFYITYVPQDTEYIHLDGSLGEKIREIGQEESVSTRITVTAEYNSYLWKKDIVIRLIKPEKQKKRSPFARAILTLQKIEEKTRADEEVTLPKQAKGVSIKKTNSFSVVKLFLFGNLCLALLLIRNRNQLREKENLQKKETLKDLPLVVHLLTLYMGAGLSFPSAVHRISLDYISRADGKKKYVFEEILRMDAVMKLGEGQQAACMQWGKRFKEPAYQKLSLTLLQVMEKGTREGRTLMNQMEREAFRHRLDQAKTEGEEASTKLLFPMILLLCMVMILIMFPAIVRFQGF